MCSLSSHILPYQTIISLYHCTTFQYTNTPHHNSITQFSILLLTIIILYSISSIFITYSHFYIIFHIINIISYLCNIHNNIDTLLTIYFTILKCFCIYCIVYCLFYNFLYTYCTTQTKQLFYSVWRFRHFFYGQLYLAISEN